MTAAAALSEQIRRALKASGLGLREISRQTGIDSSVLSRFVRGERGASLETLDKLAEYLGLQVTKRGGSPDVDE